VWKNWPAATISSPFRRSGKPGCRERQPEKKMEETAHANQIALRRHEVQLIGIGRMTKLSVGGWQNGDLRDGKDETNQTQNQEPKSPFDRQYDPGNQYRRHDPICNDR
jgi:hypothetical protein